MHTFKRLIFKYCLETLQDSLAIYSFPGENLKVAGKENAVRDVCVALSTHKVSPDVCEAAAAALVSLLLDGQLISIV